MDDNEIKPSDILIKAQELLGNRGQRWIKGAEHERRYKRVLGIPMPVLRKEDTYCSIGAMKRAAAELGKDPDSSVAVKARHLLHDEMYGDVISYNDSSTTRFDGVKKAFCAATKEALEQEQRDGHQ